MAKYDSLNLATEGCYRVQVSMRSGSCSVSVDILDSATHKELGDQSASRVYLPVLRHYAKAIKAIRNEVVKLQRMLIHIPPFYYLPTVDVGAFNLAFAEVERRTAIAKTEAKQMYEQDIAEYHALLRRLYDNNRLSQEKFNILVNRCVPIEEIDKLQVQLLDFVYCPSNKSQNAERVLTAEEQELKAEIARHAQALEQKAQAHRQELLAQGLQTVRQQAQQLVKEVLAIMGNESSKSRERMICKRLNRINRLLAFDPEHLRDFSLRDPELKTRLVQFVCHASLFDTEEVFYALYKS